MKAVVLALAIALFLPFFLGFTSAFLVPPLCWWLERRKGAIDRATDFQARAARIDAKVAEIKARLGHRPNVVPVDMSVEREVLNAWRKSRAN